MTMEIKVIPIDRPEGANIIIGQTHFIKSIEDLYEAIKNAMPSCSFGIAFNEASGDCLVRWEGNDGELIEGACKAALNIGAGHVFVILLGDAFPINVLKWLKDVPEVCTIFCATANPLELVVCETALGRGVLGVIDGSKPKGVENEGKKKERKALLRRFGYKL
jgi:hypothetical protein